MPPLASILATGVGIAIFRGVGDPLLGRYRQWRDSPREMTARPDWLGRYIPDLRRIRVERAIRIAAVTFLVFSAVVAWAIMVHPPHR